MCVLRNLCAVRGHRGEMLLWHFAPKSAELRAFPVWADHGPAMMVKEECGGQNHKLEGTVGSHPVPKPRWGGAGSQGAPEMGAESSPALSPCCTQGWVHLYHIFWPNNHRANDIFALAVDLGGIQTGDPQVKVFISYYQSPESYLSPGKSYYFEMAAKWERGRAPNTATIGHDSTFLSD